MSGFFGTFPTEQVVITKVNTNEQFEVETLFDANRLVVEDTSKCIEEGDIIERSLPNGKKEKYEIEDCSFYNNMGTFPSHYEITVRKITNRISQPKETVVNHIHISDVEKVNIQSTDNSNNYYLNSNDKELMKTLKSLAEGLDNRESVISNIDEMEANVGKKSFAEKYNSFIQSIANHMTIFAPFIPSLTQLLMKSQ